MAIKLPSRYEIKKLLMLPRKLYMRRKENLEPGFMRSALELHYYRPAFYHWLRARSQDDSLLHDAPVTAGDVVLDVGAYIGEWAEEIDSLYQPEIHAFEPDPKNFRQLQKRADRLPHLRAYGFGLNDKDERLPMSLEFLGSSVFGQTGGKQGVDWEEVELRDIVRVWLELELSDVALMKINIEGGEFPLMERMIEAELLGHVNCYLIQFHEWHPGAYHRRRRIQKALSRTHRLVWDHHFVWEKWLRK